jgi:hypothetical protein
VTLWETEDDDTRGLIGELGSGGDTIGSTLEESAENALFAVELGKETWRELLGEFGKLSLVTCGGFVDVTEEKDVGIKDKTGVIEGGEGSDFVRNRLEKGKVVSSNMTSLEIISLPS